MLGSRVVRIRWLAVTTITVCLFIVLAVMALASVDNKIESLNQVMKSQWFVTVVASTVGAIALGVISSVVYGMIENTGYRLDLARIQSLTDPDLLEQILQTASKYGDKICGDRSIRYTLERTTNERILQLTGQYSYRRKLDRHLLTFRFVRLRDAREKMTNAQMASGIGEQLRGSEFYFVMDEVEIREDLGVGPRDTLLDPYYSISDLRVDGIPVTLSRVPGTDLEYSALLPRTVSLSKHVRLSYSVKCPLAYTDYFFSNLSLPTNGNEISFDYSALKSELWADVVEVFSAMDNTVSSTRDGKGVLTVGHSGWAMPRSGVMFVWSKL